MSRIKIKKDGKGVQSIGEIKIRWKPFTGHDIRDAFERDGMMFTIPDFGKDSGAELYSLQGCG